MIQILTNRIVGFQYMQIRKKVNRPVQKFNYSSKSNATNSQLRMPAAAYSSLVISRK